MLNVKLRKFYEEKITEELEGLKDYIKGVRNAGLVIEDLEDPMSIQVQLFYNEQLELVFKKSTGILEFKTTFSNQLIDRKMMDIMYRFYQRQAIIESYLKMVDYYLNEEKK